MRVDLFDFQLPDDRIALRPAEPRESARLLDVCGGLADRTVAELPALLRRGDALVVNDTRVIPARLSGTRRRGDGQARIEATLHKREGADRWLAFVRPAKKLRPGETVRFGTPEAPLDATCLAHSDGGEVLFGFALAGAALDEGLRRNGSVPLPPYIAGKRPADGADVSDYQTVYADRAGAVAAPTAGLHFTPALLDAIQKRGVSLVRLTLHVGAGTFLPVKAADTIDHRMHSEWGELDAPAVEILNETRRSGGRIVAAGTTSLRLLESAAAVDGTLQPFRGETAIFITPGHVFRAVDCLFTNFHLPRSTLFMLVAAFTGLERMRAAYAHAIAGDYRFYSYGDACFLHRATP